MPTHVIADPELFRVPPTTNKPETVFYDNAIQKMPLITDKPWAIENLDRVKLTNIVCVAYGHPDIKKMHEFLTDFGMVESHRAPDSGGAMTIYYRGYGVQPIIYISKHTKEPEFLGIFYEAASEQEFRKARNVPGAGEIEDWQFGGKKIKIIDPCGMPFHVVYGQQKRAFTPRTGEILAINYPAPVDDDPIAKPRRGEFHRLSRGIVPVHKLGHSGFVVDDLDTEIEFYCRHFNFKPSDIVAGAGRDENQVFMHIDLGKTYTEHHAFIIACPFGPLKAGQPHHAAFEVESMDTTFVGHEYMGSKGHKAFWGVGRHIEGSQVFDYWFDPDGFMMEHYADGDLVNENKEVGFVPAVSHHEMNNWGPPVNLGPPKAGANGH